MIDSQRIAFAILAMFLYSVLPSFVSLAPGLGKGGLPTAGNNWLLCLCGFCLVVLFCTLV